MKDIDENLDEIVAEKKEYYSNLNGDKSTSGKAVSQSAQSKVSKLTSQPNVFSIMDERKGEMEKIDEKLRLHNPTAFSALSSHMSSLEENKS